MAYSPMKRTPLTLRESAAQSAACRARETPERRAARLAKQREYQRKKYARLRAAGLCVTCRAPTAATYCDPCKPRVVR
jgi:hypothetical protein